MVKHHIILFGMFLFAFTSMQFVKAETVLNAEDSYVTTDDIVSDLLFPTIDKRVIKEYGGGELFDWQWQRIVGIKYNDNHSYDVKVRINIPTKNSENVKVDLVTVRVSPSCDSGKINKQKCNHEFKIEILEYNHLSK
jgi:hypothetical protein